MGIHVTNSCMYSKEVLWGLGGCAGDCAQFTSSGGVSPQDLVHIAGYVFPRQAAGEESSGMPDPAYIGVVTSLAGAFSSGQYRWCHTCLQFWVTVFKQWRPCFHCVQLLMSESTILLCVSKMCWLCSVNEKKCVLASTKVFSVSVNVFRRSANVFRVLWNRRLRWNVFIVKPTRGLIY